VEVDGIASYRRLASMVLLYLCEKESMEQDKEEERDYRCWLYCSAFVVIETIIENETRNIDHRRREISV
jgi:hypothetical protein